mgnify:CR=1 FL=1
MKTRVLVTGAAGFGGSHLVDYLIQDDSLEVFGTKRWGESTENLIQSLDKMTLIDCDFTDMHSVEYALFEAYPNFIIHLAAQSFVPYSYSAPIATMQSNVIGTLNLLESCLNYGPDKLVLVTSSEVYGQVEANEVPIIEAQPFRPVSPYGVSKVAQDMAGFMYWKAYNLPIVRLRPFTFTGPRQNEGLACSAFARQIALIEKGKQPPEIRVGNLDSVRTFCDVRDMVRAFWMARGLPPGEVYNVGGLTTMMVGDMLNHLLLLSKVPNIKIVQDPRLLRPADVTLQIPYSEKFRAATGWKEEHQFDETLVSLLDYWRSKI